MNLFKGKTFRVQVEDTPKPPVDFGAWKGVDIKPLPDPPVVKWIVTPDDINDVITTTVTTVGVAYAGVKVLNTLCKVAEIAAKHYFR